MVIKLSDICNFADDNTLYSYGEWLTEIKENLIFDTKSILKWFRLNSLKANPGKFQFSIPGDKSYHKHIFRINSINPIQDGGLGQKVSSLPIFPL